MPDPTRTADGPISAVFVLDVAPVVAPMLAGWVEKGHRIAAIVVPGPRPGKRRSVSTWRRRLRRKRVLKRHLGSAPAPLIEFSIPYDWDALSRHLAGLDADVLICFGFRTLIPQAVLELFAKGGLNLHPALLPHFRGPHPIHRLIIDQQYETHGGVTLHKMTSGFDEGDILAQIAFSPGDWRSAAAISRALASGMKMLATEAAPDHCMGRLAGMLQPAGDFTWAQLDRIPLVADGQWSSTQVARMWRVFGRHVAVHVSVNGRLVRLAHPIRRLGPATGRAPARAWGTVEFDCSDGRVTHLVYNGFSKLLMRWQRIFSRLRIEPRSFEMRRFGERGPDRTG